MAWNADIPPVPTPSSYNDILLPPLFLRDHNADKSDSDDPSYFLRAFGGMLQQQLYSLVHLQFYTDIYINSRTEKNVLFEFGDRSNPKVF